MESLIIFILVVITIVILKIMLGSNKKIIMQIANNEKLNNIVQKLPDNINICKDILKKLIIVPNDEYTLEMVKNLNFFDKIMTFEEFQKEHELETELQIRDLKNYANYVVDNNGTYTDLYEQIDKIIKENN